jgi:hypothetical protein
MDVGQRKLQDYSKDKNGEARMKRFPASPIHMKE